jgi:hypothetical protein
LLAFELGIGYGVGGRKVVPMTTKDPKSGAEPANDPLSATGIFLNAFRTQPEEPAKENVAPSTPATPGTSESKPPAPGEFTQLFGAIKPVPPAPVQNPLASPPRPETPPQAPEEVTRIFVRQAAVPLEQPPKASAGPAPVAPAQRMKGFSSPGASDSASDDGGFSQFFRRVPAPSAPVPPPPPKSMGATDLFAAIPAAEAPNAKPDSWQQMPPPPKSMGATDLFDARPAAEAPKVKPDSWQPGSEAGSVTAWMRKLSEEGEPPSSTQIFEAETPAPAAPPGQGEYTRIISGDARKAAKEAEPVPVPAPPKMQAPAIEPPKVAAPKLASPAVAAPPGKLQQMLPILLVLNGFLLVVLILLVIFVLLRK